jgi:hypothetical protein
LPAVQNLVRDLLRGPILVLPDVSQWRTFLAANPLWTVAVLAVLPTEEERTGFFVGFCGMGHCSGLSGLGNGDKEEKR